MKTVRAMSSIKKISPISLIVSYEVQQSPTFVNRMKEQVRENKTPKKIGNIRFTRFSSDEIRRLSNLPIFTPELYQPGKREPCMFGPLDKRLVTLLFLTLHTTGHIGEESDMRHLWQEDDRL